MLHLTKTHSTSFTSHPGAHPEDSQPVRRNVQEERSAFPKPATFGKIPFAILLHRPLDLEKVKNVCSRCMTGMCSIDHWLVVWNILCFSIYWEESSQLTNIFQRVETTNQLDTLKKYV